MRLRPLFAQSDSTLVTKNGNTNSAESGKYFENAFNMRKDCWKDRSQQIHVAAVCAGRQIDFLRMVENLIDTEAGGDPIALRGKSGFVHLPQRR